MSIRIPVNERTKALTPEKPEDDGMLHWNLTSERPPEKKSCCNNCGPQCQPNPPVNIIPPEKPTENNLSSVDINPDNELYEKILKALEKDHKRHYMAIVKDNDKDWIPDGEYFYVIIDAKKHNIIYPIVKQIFIINDEDNSRSAALFYYKVLKNSDIQIFASKPMNYEIYIESEE